MSNNKTRRGSKGNRNRGKGGNKPNERKELRRDLSHEKDSGKYQQTEEKLNSLNDISWYNKYPELSEAAARIPFPFKPGMQYELGTLYGSTNSATPAKQTYGVPGIVPSTWALRFYPSIGWSEDNNSPASQAAKEWYGKVRESFSGGLDADAPDFMMYVIGLDSIYSYISTLQRLYACLNSYTPENPSIPESILAALGLSDEQVQYFRANLDRLWGAINQLTRQSLKFRCPDVMDILRRHFWMNQNVYTDSESLNGQLYVFVQRGYYMVETDSEGATMLTMLDAPTFTGATDLVKVLYDFGSNLISAMNAWDDGYTISGYLKRAFEGSPDFVVPLTANQAVITPVYVEEVLYQIENARTIIGTINANSLDITQDVNTNALIHKPYAGITYNITAINPSVKAIQAIRPSITHRTAVPSYQEVILSTRLQANMDWTDFSPTAVGAQGINIIAGTEILTDFGVYTTLVGGPRVPTPSTSVVYQSTGSFTSYLTMPVQSYGEASNVEYVASNVANVINEIALISAWDWHPMLFLYVDTRTQTTSLIHSHYLMPIGDIHNWTTFEQSQLREIHRVCALSEFSAYSIM